MHSPSRPDGGPAAPRELPPEPMGPLASTLRDVFGCVGVIMAAVLISMLCVHLSHAFPELSAK
ncbi:MULTISPECIES: hypothetical protein [Streptomyces]|uniref:hypothetical protein n=1 Tax=Streptomyces TaxID=1883 RepID=UPI00117D8CA2|nr:MULTISPECIES: hypothetical protein [Streptomyces]MCD9141065.1 hypothetical protein [Streptomyces albireticuli]MCD9160973.1 hypothetical protein [Streptomyces albireticuli]MCD9190969.1 hypothetical protein [Streptomyces albireticuli]UQI46816.1 hypothetical protein M1P56_21925 [Streptomyces sp. HU2014]